MNSSIANIWNLQVDIKMTPYLDLLSISDFTFIYQPIDKDMLALIFGPYIYIGSDKSIPRVRDRQEASRDWLSKSRIFTGRRTGAKRTPKEPDR